MKHTKIFPILLLSAGMLFACNTPLPQGQNNQLKVLSWNIWHGGHSKEYPGDGCEGTIGILKESQADVITMIETYGSSDKVADSLGYYHRLLSSNLSIYSRYPIIETYTFPDSIRTFNFGGVMIDVNGQKVRIFDTWLHYLPATTIVPTDSSEKAILAWETAGTRDDEIRKILSVLRPYLAQADSIPIVMSGDFNSHSHLDWTEETKDLYDHNGAVVRWPVSLAMEQAGFKDSFREMNPDAAKNLGRTWRYGEGTTDRYDRIDYIYYTGDKLKLLSSESHNGLLGEIYSFQGKDFFYGSDHGFVISTFNIE